MRSKLLIQQIGHTEFPASQQQTQSCILRDCPFQKPKTQKCIVCHKKCSYKCPKCKISYCGIQHYRSHNLFCSEQFYEKQVKEGLKGMRVTDRGNKRKAADMVREYREMIDGDAGDHIEVERLEEILRDMQAGIQPKLTTKQQLLFQQYLQNTLSNTQNPQTQLQQPYWQIEQGLSLYLREQDIQIQQYALSQNLDLVTQRTLFKQQLKQFTSLHPYTEMVVRPVIYGHLLQIVYGWVLLWRVYDGECAEFRDLFMEAYCSKENQRLLRVENVEAKDFVTEIQIQILKAQGQIEVNAVTIQWLKEYWEILSKDLQGIFNNTFLIMETLLRIIGAVSMKNKNQFTLQSINSTKYSSKESKQCKKSIIIIKKCEYLLYIVKYFFIKERCQTQLGGMIQFMKKRGDENPQSKIETQQANKFRI